MRPSSVTCPGYAGYDGWIYCGTELEVGARGPIPKHCGPCKDAISRRRKDSGVGSPERKSRRRKPLDEERQYQAAVRAVPMPADLMAKGWRGDIPRGPKLRKELTGIRPLRGEDYEDADQSTGVPPVLTFDPFWRELQRRGPDVFADGGKWWLFVTADPPRMFLAAYPEGEWERAQQTLTELEQEKPMTNAELAARIEALEQRLALYLEETSATARRIADRLPDNDLVQTAVEAFIHEATRTP